LKKRRQDDEILINKSRLESLKSLSSEDSNLYTDDFETPENDPANVDEALRAKLKDNEKMATENDQKVLKRNHFLFLLL
jgi:hypothetical protein